MKHFKGMMIWTMLLTILVGCGKQIPQQNHAAVAATTQTTVDTHPDDTTEPVSVIPTEATIPQGEPMTDLDPMGLVGTWQRTHTEVEGDKNKNTHGSITVSGADSGSLKLTFRDKESPNFDTEGKSLEILAGELFAQCGNDIWYGEATDGSNTYAITLLDDNTLLLQLTFDFDGQPMVSTQWFIRS